MAVLPSKETEERLLKEARERKREAQERDMMFAAEQDQMAREAWAREQARLDALEAERLRKEAERKAKEEEEARKALLKARAQAELIEIVVCIRPTFAPGEVLAEVVLQHGATVEALRNGAFNMARLPFQPRLLFMDGGTLTGKTKLTNLGEKTQLIDLPLNSGDCVLAKLVAVLTTSKDRTAKVWDAATGECLYSLQGHEGAVCSATASSDLKYIVTCSEDNTAKLWVVQRESCSASCLFTFRGHTKTVNSAAFSPDGKFVVTSSSDCTAKIWTVRTGLCQRSFEGHRGAVFAASFTPDGTKIQTQARDSTVKDWEVETGRCTNTQPLWEQPETVTSAAEDGSVIVKMSGSLATVCEVATGHQVPLTGHGDEITSVSYVEVHPHTHHEFRPASPKNPNDTGKMTQAEKAKAELDYAKIQMKNTSGWMRKNKETSGPLYG